MARLSHFRPKVGKLSFKEVAKASGVSGVGTKKFRDKAFEALRESGYGASEARGILGKRKMEHSSLKKVFDKLKKYKVTTKGGGSTVGKFVEKEIDKQKRIALRNIDKRAEEIKAEKKAEEEAKLKQAGTGAASKKKSSFNQATPIAGEGFGPTQSKEQQTPIDQSFFTPQTNVKKAPEQGSISAPAEEVEEPPEQVQEPEDMVID